MTLQIAPQEAEPTPIPQPPAHFLVGNLPELKRDATPLESVMKLAREYGPIFQLNLGGERIIVASSFELADELCDTKRFDKGFGPGLKQVRVFSGDGLFSAYTHEPNWRKAHNILMPNFSHAAMKRYAPAMVEIARQLVAKWEKAADSGALLDVPDDMTRLTLDTIGLCGFDHRFESFQREKPHPFVDAMLTFLSGMQENARRLSVVNKMLFLKQKKLNQSRQFINDYVDDIVRERKSAPDQGDKVDLLNYMLNGVDRESGEQLEDLTIRLNIITFLIAGHETTSGLLSFAIYFLLHHPEVLAKAYEEVDRVLSDEPTFEQINQLQYLLQILKETLRLYPTAPFFTLAPYEDTMLAGKYFIPKDQPVQLLLPILHRDPAIWGPHADQFNPDNFAAELEETRPVNAFKGFGNGQRACIGRQFALQEAVLVLGMLLQRFRLIDATQYKLHLKQSLTIKPGDFHIKVQKRPARESKASPTAAPVAPPAKPQQRPTHNTPLLVLYGSNTGTCEAFARQIAEDGEARGFQVQVAEMDHYCARLPREGATLIVSSSYNGAPPDNAVKFCQWLEEKHPEGALQGVKFGVFGAGNRDWAASYQQVPKRLDARLAELGAERIYPRGEGDARGDFDGHFSKWFTPLWPELAEKLGIQQDLAAEEKVDLYEIEFLEQKRENPFVAAFGAQPMTIVDNREIFASGCERSARHLEVVLPEGMNYRIGDHLGVIARNSEALVKRAAGRFKLDPEARIRIKKKGRSKTLLPLDQVVPLGEVLREHVELQDVATRKHIKVLADHCQCPPEQRNLNLLAQDDGRYHSEVLDKGKSILDLLEGHPSCDLPFNLFLEMLAGLRPRYYSISSSPLQAERICSITVGVLDAAARSGHGRYRGVCSNYLAGLKKGQRLYAFVRENHPNFHLPSDPQQPILMVGPGTGLAPFRGFLQERAALKSQGETLGPAMLFFGCRHPEEDFLYQEELEEFVEGEICRLVTAFSRQHQEKVYVQHKIAEHKDEVWQLLQQECTIYICGDGGRMAPDVRRAFAQIYQEKTGRDAESWLKEMENGGRYMVDVWSSG